jgi:hypothetical protein
MPIGTFLFLAIAFFGIMKILNFKSSNKILIPLILLTISLPIVWNAFTENFSPFVSKLLNDFSWLVFIFLAGIAGFTCYKIAGYLKKSRQETWKDKRKLKPRERAPVWMEED